MSSLRLFCGGVARLRDMGGQDEVDRLRVCERKPINGLDLVLDPTATVQANPQVLSGSRVSSRSGSSC